MAATNLERKMKDFFCKNAPSILYSANHCSLSFVRGEAISFLFVVFRNDTSRECNIYIYIKYTLRERKTNTIHGKLSVDSCHCSLSLSLTRECRLLDDAHFFFGLFVKSGFNIPRLYILSLFPMCSLCHGTFH